MTKDNTKSSKSTHEHTAKRPAAANSKGRSFCCSMFIYTFVFVSGVVVATILPDLVGHHFKQPYGKEYGVMVEQMFKDLPTHLNRLSETAMVMSRELVDRVWDLKAELQKRIESMSNKNEDFSKTKTNTQRSTTRASSNK